MGLLEVLCRKIGTEIYLRLGLWTLPCPYKHCLLTVLVHTFTCTSNQANIGPWQATLKVQPKPDSDGEDKALKPTVTRFGDIGAGSGNQVHPFRAHCKNTTRVLLCVVFLVRR